MYLLIVLAIIFVILQPFSKALMFIPNEPLTWLTGHFVHLGYVHIFMNIMGIATLIFFMEQKIDYKKMTGHILISSLFISFCLYLQNYAWYVGFSGILHTLFFIAFWNERKDWSGKAGLVILFSKIIFENVHHSDNYEGFLGGHVATPAHLYGVLAGMLIIFAYKLIDLYKSKNLVFQSNNTKSL